MKHFLCKTALVVGGLTAVYAKLRKEGNIESINSEGFADSVKKYGKEAGLQTLEKGLTGALKSVEKHLKTADEPVVGESLFYPGLERFHTSASKNAKWKCGSAWASLVPDDWREHAYFLGGYMVLENQFNNHVENIIDDMRIRCIALSADEDDGVALFGTIDCIGISNKDIRVIRKKVSEKAIQAGVKILSCNISSTHCHSGIDTQGLWTRNQEQKNKISSNIFKSLFGLGEIEKGADMHFLNVLYERAADALWRACLDMVPGKMFYAKKDLGSAYFDNRNRPSATSLPTYVHRFLFIPADKSKKSTCIVNLNGHPDVVGLPTSDGKSSGREVSGDFVYYMGNTIAEAGYNCMFFNGSIAGIYIGRGPTNDGQPLQRRYMESERYGHEMGKIVLSLTKTAEEIKANPLLCNPEKEAEEAKTGGDGYTLWYKDWTPVAERELPAVLNIKLKECKVTVTNPVMRVAGKMQMANYDFMEDGNGFYTVVTEIGLMEWGNVRIAMVPGEMVTDLYLGGASLTADGSCRHKDFGYPCLCELFGEELVCFGLFNDAIGYIVPDNDYSMRLVDGHYHETISLGDRTASAIMQTFIALKTELADSLQ